MKNEIKFKKFEKRDITNKLESEFNTIGYYSLPSQDTLYLDTYLQNFKQKEFENIVVIGIGGSSLGTKAMYDFLRYRENLSKKIVFLDSTDPLFLQEISNTLDFKKSHFIVISKSGTTLETISVYKYIYQQLQNLSLELKDYFTFITDEGSKLEKYAQHHNFNIVNIQKNVGGRFSALSSASLIPLALAGIDVKKILKGAKLLKENFFSKKEINDELHQKAIFIAKHFDTYKNNCIFAYSERLKFFVHWYVQLWGESLGKKQQNSELNIGLTPIGLIGPKDQHSFLQLIEEGPRDKSITFIQVDNFSSELEVPNIELKYLEELNTMNSMGFETIINLQSNSIIQSLLKKPDIPVDIIKIANIDEESIGELIYYYELLTSMVAIYLGVDAYNQPGVENGKKILNNSLKEYNKK